MRIYLLCPMCPVSYNYIYFFEGVFKFTDATFMSMHESTLLSNFFIPYKDGSALTSGARLNMNRT